MFFVPSPEEGILDYIELRSIIEFSTVARILEILAVYEFETFLPTPAASVRT